MIRYSFKKKLLDLSFIKQSSYSMHRLNIQEAT